MKILALQGGGCRGKGQAVALLELEAQAGRPLCQVFDLAGGTSVGAIIGAAVALGLPMKAVNQFFDEQAPQIFAGGLWNKVRQAWRPKYDGSKLAAALQSVFGAHTMADCKTKLIITAFDVASGRNVYFQNYGVTSITDEEIVIGADARLMERPIWWLVRASASAQSYFPAKQLGQMTLLDGGNTGCAAPDMLCLTEAIELGTPLSEVKMLSLGTGTSPWSDKGVAMRRPSALRAGLATIDILFAGSNTNEVWQAASMLRSNHFRLDPNLYRAYALDDASATTLASIEEAMRNEITRHPDYFKPFIS